MKLYKSHLLKCASRFLSAIALAITLHAAPAHAFTDTEEIELGREWTEYAEYMFGGVLPDNAPESQRVTRIGRRFAHLAPRRGFNVRYKVVNNNKLLNAFTIPAGGIYITKGMVNFAKTDSELASILGHETAHMALRHIGKAMDERRRTERITQALGKKLYGSNYDENQDSFTYFGSALLQSILTRGHKQQHEMEADAVALRWMSKLKYDPRANISIMQRMQQHDAKRPEYKGVKNFNNPFSTHPSLAERIARTQRQIEKENLLQIAGIKVKPSATLVVTPTPVASPTPQIRETVTDLAPASTQPVQTLTATPAVEPLTAQKTP